VKTVVLGAIGQVGQDMVTALQPDHTVVALSKADVDVTNSENVRRVLSELRPDLVVNAAAFMNADRCESFPEAAYLVNTVGARTVSRACADIDAVCVWFSSDFVFDGRKGTSYVEEDTPNPLMTYGVTKLAGECEVRSGNDRHYIIRTASLFGTAGIGGRGANFIENMIAKSRKGRPLQVVDDILMSPTYATDLAAMVVRLVEAEAPYGTYHIVNEGTASWYELCEAALRLTGQPSQLEAIRIGDRPEAKARRPLYTVMESTRLPEVVRCRNRPWREALRAYMAAKGYL
jgi:dTDP-4-dehydrorhamnose reductase